MQPPGWYGEDLTEGTKYPPLSLAYIGAYLREKGHEIKIIDATAEGFTHQETVAKIKEFNPSIVGITSTTTIIKQENIITFNER